MDAAQVRNGAIELILSLAVVAETLDSKDMPVLLAFAAMVIASASGSLGVYTLAAGLANERDAGAD